MSGKGIPEDQMFCRDSVLSEYINSRPDPDKALKNILGKDGNRSSLECSSDVGENGELFRPDGSLIIPEESGITAENIVPERVPSSAQQQQTWGGAGRTTSKAADGSLRLTVSNWWNHAADCHCPRHRTGSATRALMLQRLIDPIIPFKETDTIPFNHIKKFHESRRASELAQKSPSKLRRVFLKEQAQQQKIDDHLQDELSGRVSVEQLGIDLNDNLLDGFGML